MNRLIIIGNGFDLSLGLKSKFSDFLESYINEVINIVLKNGTFDDKLLKVSIPENDIPHLKLDRKKYPNVFDLFRYYRKNRINYFSVKSDLLNRILLQQVEHNWVDIEGEFYKGLLEVFEGTKEIDTFNNQFKILKSSVLKYLRNQESNFNNNIEPYPYIDLFIEDINKEEVVVTDIAVAKMKPQSLYFLNFNYTKFLSQFVRNNISTIPKTVNYIHGNLRSSQEEPIFGFGDEMDKQYQIIEESNDNRYFHFFKSFDYSKTKNYFDMIRFLESDLYQVHIYGHSCGLSDRTMLNQIFEHNNCVSIKIFYHKSGEYNDYLNKIYEISRHFKDKGLMRKKIVPFDLSREMPQYI